MKLVLKKYKGLTKVPGQLMIWRSGFGCDLVEFIEESQTQYYSCKVKMLTGICAGSDLTFSESQLRDTTREVYERYDQRFYW